MTRIIHRWTEEDAAFCAAQWASGIGQREIAAIYGHSNPSTVCREIAAFLLKYSNIGNEVSDRWYPVWNTWDGRGRKGLVKGALAAFVAARAPTTPAG